MVVVTRRKMLTALAGSVIVHKLSRAADAVPSALFDVRQFGAIGDGNTVNTAAMQRAIDDCAAHGGGTVLIPKGTYVTGTLFLKNNVTLSVESGGVLLGSPRIGDYLPGTWKNMYAHETEMDHCLIFAQDAVNIGLRGMGTIDGQGKAFPNQGDPTRSRPMLLRLVNCRNVFLHDLTLENPAAWTSAFLYCNDVRVDGISISSRIRGNGDGMDFDGCQDVRISNCQLDNSDDSICLQTSEPSRPIRNVVITNCIMSTQWAAIRIGLLSRGTFQDVTVSNCVFHDIAGEALKIQLAEGGRMENFLFSDIVMRNVPRPVFVTFNSFPFRVDSPGEPPPMQSLRNVTFSNMRIESDGSAPDSQDSFLAVLGLPGHLIEGITFDNITFIAPGGVTDKDSATRVVPELTGTRPERKPLGSTLPSYGLFARHVRNLKLTNVTLQTREKDLRPGIVCDDVEALRLSNVGLSGGTDATPLIVLRDTRDALIQGSYPLQPSSLFLRVEGSASAGICLMDNDLRLAKHPLDRDKNVASQAVTLQGNME